MPGPQPTPTGEPPERSAGPYSFPPGWTGGAAPTSGPPTSDPPPVDPRPVAEAPTVAEWSAAHTGPVPHQGQTLVPRQPAALVPVPGSAVEPVASPAVAASAVRPRRPAGRLSWTCLVLVLVVSAVIGLAAYQTLATIDITSMDPLGAALAWSVVVGVALVLTPFLFVLAVVAVVRNRGLVAVLGLVAAMILPLGSLVVGGQVGVNAFAAHLTEETEGVRDVAFETAQQGLAGLGPAAGPFSAWLLENFGDVEG